MTLEKPKSVFALVGVIGLAASCVTACQPPSPTLTLAPEHCSNLPTSIEDVGTQTYFHDHYQEMNVKTLAFLNSDFGYFRQRPEAELRDALDSRHRRIVEIITLVGKILPHLTTGNDIDGSIQSLQSNDTAPHPNDETVEVLRHVVMSMALESTPHSEDDFTAYLTELKKLELLLGNGDMKDITAIESQGRAAMMAYEPFQNHLKTTILSPEFQANLRTAAQKFCTQDTHKG